MIAELFMSKEDRAYKRGWEAGFSAGMLKSWDSLLPIMSENIDKLKQKIKDDAIMETINRLNLSKGSPHASNKK